MVRRVALLFVVALSGGAGLAGAACSSSNGSGGGADASAADGTVGGDGASDSAADGLAPDAGPLVDAGGDGGIVGNCSPVKGPCDIVRQDCPQGQECVVVTGSDGGFATGCKPQQNSEHVPKGALCCPSASANPCLPGLECLGADCVDGSAPTARCTPHCCSGDDSLCGMSPEGYPGTCNLVVSGGSPPVDLFNGCTYEATCKPLGVQPCPSGMVCIVEDPQGTAKCANAFADDASTGYGEGHGCTYANNCQDGLNCVTPADGGAASCVMLCLVPNSTPPFDAGSLSGGPLHGGCDPNKTCVATNLYPSWLGVCQ